jgi:hypothetical protein
MDSPRLQEARRRIKDAARDKAEELDLGGLGLTEIPEELYALTFEGAIFGGSQTPPKNTLLGAYR